MDYKISRFMGRAYNFFTQGKGTQYIVKIDGGICSQIAQYMIGYSLLFKGYKVKFDIDWFKKDGKDLDGVQIRNFDLLKMSPQLDFIKANKLELILFKYFFKSEVITSDITLTKNEFQNPPLFIGNYYNLGTDIYKLIPTIVKFDFKINDANEKMSLKIEQTVNSVCVHVRRGDMAKAGLGWHVLKPKYYFEAMEIFENSKFFLFSDDFSWVKENILPIMIQKAINFEIVDINKSENAYCDLYLMNKCKNFICSSGSLGKFASIYSSYEYKTMVIPTIADVYPWEVLSALGKVIPIMLNEENCENL